MAAAQLVDLRDVRMADLAQVGPKLARLGELSKRGWRVPEGYVVTVTALQRWLSGGRRANLERLLADWPADPADAEARAARVRALIVAEGVDGGLREGVRAAHARLERGAGGGSPQLVAVRSSAVAEDGVHASFAGQFETYLGVAGPTAVLQRIVACWASLYSGRAIGYRQSRGFPLLTTDFAVGVLELVDARSAGVLFTVDPVGGDAGAMVVEANWGLGESVVGGLVTPDRWVVDRDSWSIREARTTTKEAWTAVDAEAGGVTSAPLPRALRERPSLTDDEVLLLCRQAARLELEQGGPQDVEWAIDRTADEVVWLQHRPVTALPRPESYRPVEYALRHVFRVEP